VLLLRSARDVAEGDRVRLVEEATPFRDSAAPVYGGMPDPDGGAR
jgi:hypothetical protein